MLVLSWIAVLSLMSSSWISIAVTAQYPVSMEYMMFYRMLLASIMISSIMFFKKNRFKLSKQEVFFSVLVSSSQMNVWLSSYATKYLISGLVPCITITQIFTAELMSAVYEKRKMKTNIIISGIVGMIGIVLLCNQQFQGLGKTDAKTTIIGVVLAFLSTFAAAIGNLIYEKKQDIFSKMPKATFMFYNCLFAGIFFLLLGALFFFFFLVYNEYLFDKKFMANIVFLSVGATTLALFALYYIIEKQGSVKATYINFIMPILSMIISTLFEGFKWNILAVIGMLTVLLSVFIGIKQKKV